MATYSKWTKRLAKVGFGFLFLPILIWAISYPIVLGFSQQEGFKAWGAIFPFLIGLIASGISLTIGLLLSYIALYKGYTEKWFIDFGVCCH